MTVPLLDIPGQFRALTDETTRAIREVLESGRYVLGPRLEELESNLRDLCGVRDAVGVSSGTDALLLCLQACGVGAGDEVITTPFTFFATAGVIHRLGATVVFADIDPVTCNLSPEKAADAITDETRAILPVHLYGLCARMDAFSEIARRHGLMLVEDAAQAIGARFRGARAGSLGDCAAFSFYPTKNLGAAGEGGLVTTSDERIASKIRSLRVHGESSRYHHDEVGMNARLDEIQAAVLLSRLPHLEEWNSLRRRAAASYRRLFGEAGLEELTLPVEPDGCEHVYHQYVVRVADRDRLMEHLKSNEVGCAVYYPVPLHLQKCFAYLGYKEGDFPEAERASNEVLALPIFPHITPDQQEEVVGRIAEFYGPTATARAGGGVGG